MITANIKRFKKFTVIYRFFSKIKNKTATEFKKIKAVKAFDNTFAL